ncbi:hypothetical protein NMA58_11895 [Rhizobium sp. YTUHZ045]|uniref:hypothetical protein n=1 Tax=Rhizobium sp. YTUHZ045 TaxID=2962888 RepID=UPI003DA858B2
MKREREPSSKAYRQDRFENTERAAKETIEAEQRARREKTKRLKELRLSQQGGKDPAAKERSSAPPIPSGRGAD